MIASLALVPYLLTACLAGSASAGDERQAARSLYDLTGRSAQALGNAPYDRPASQNLKAELEKQVEAFTFNTDGKNADALFNCDQAARQLVAILSDAILAQPAAPARAKLMHERAKEWTTEMQGCRRFLKAPAIRVDMQRITRSIAGG